MKKYLLKRILALTLLATTGGASAQGPGSAETIGGTIGVDVYSSATGNTTASAAETLYIGPGNYLINGTWEIYSKNVWISPDAVITGTGTIKFFNPSVAGGASSPSLTDGNNSTNFINVNMELDNAGNMVLTDIPGPGAPWTDATGLANFSTGADFKFNVTNGNVLLGNFDMITASSATLSGYQPSQFVVTNGSGHLVHINYTGNFIYPVGITGGDYTPAAINSTAANTYHVLVQNYATSASAESGNNGIDRTWNIYSDNAATATMDLEHNSVTDQSSFNDASEFVTRWSATIPNATGDNTLSQTAWQSNTLLAGTSGALSSAGPVSGSVETSHAYSNFATTASDPIAFYTKSSNQLTPLPITLVSFEGFDKNCQAVLNWKTGIEINFDHFDVQQSTDGTAFKTIATVRSNQAVDGSAYSGVYDQPAGSEFYRLSMADKDGSLTFSKTIVVRTTCDIGGGNSGFTIYPNPVSGHNQLYLKYTASANGSAIITCHHVDGRLIYSYPVTLHQGSNTIALPVYEMASGVYLFQLDDHSGNPAVPLKVLKN